MRCPEGVDLTGVISNAASVLASGRIAWLLRFNGWRQDAIMKAVHRQIFSVQNKANAASCY
jgi:fido (protein-threonine AMPylation protein)